MLVVSVEYRRAPEHPLPAAYDDAWATLRCAAARVDPWLAERGNLARVFLGGDSAGANIAHNVAMRVATEGLGVRIEGSILIHLVLGEKEIGVEEAERRRGKMKGFWEVVSPGTEVAKDPRLNPMAEGKEERLRTLECERVMVAVEEKDALRERGREYYEGLKRSGLEGRVELLESEREEHVTDLN
uniref:Alpha/beta hydrolase fold-3 domain-containing protein n=1 Tax=Ananas comosus var. bracteatus TaxID=296719 RepID=A0A6V7PTY7_ANACO|nr:unnamed protein product [Ananas comosus var. bracteatus]